MQHRYRYIYTSARVCVYVDISHRYIYAGERHHDPGQVRGAGPGPSQRPPLPQDEVKQDGDPHRAGRGLHLDSAPDSARRVIWLQNIL